MSEHTQFSEFTSFTQLGAGAVLQRADDRLREARESLIASVKKYGQRAVKMKAKVTITVEMVVAQVAENQIDSTLGIFSNATCVRPVEPTVAVMGNVGPAGNVGKRIGIFLRDGCGQGDDPHQDRLFNDAGEPMKTALANNQAPETEG